MRWKRVALALASLGFGVMIAAGGVLEVLNLLMPSLFPALQDSPMMRLHHTEPVVFVWTLGSNLVGVAAGVGFVATAVGLIRRRAWAAPVGRRAARAMLVVAVGAALVCGVYLVPPLWRGLADPVRHVESLVLLLSIAGSTLFVPIVPLVVHTALAPGRAARIVANNRSGSVLPQDDHSSPPGGVPPRPDAGAGVVVRAGQQSRSR